MSSAAIRAAIAAAEAEKAKAEKEKVDCEKELEKCYELLQKLDLISADYTDCQIKLSQTINNMNNGCIEDQTFQNQASV